MPPESRPLLRAVIRANRKELGRSKPKPKTGFRRPNPKPVKKPPSVVPFTPPGTEEICFAAKAAVQAWCVVNPAGGRDRVQRNAKTVVEPYPLFEWMEGRVVECLETFVGTLHEGGFIKKSTLRRMLGREAQKAMEAIVLEKPFMPPPESVLRRIAAECARAEKTMDRIQDFDAICDSYCAIALGYEGNHVEEFVYLHLMREVNRLRKGRLMQPGELQARLESAARISIREIGVKCILMASEGRSVGTISHDGKIAVKSVMSTQEGNKDVFLIALQKGEDKDGRILLDLVLPRKFYSIRPDSSPGYYNQPYLRH